MLLAAPWSRLEKLLLAAIAIATLFCTLITPGTVRISVCGRA